jgi:hypothetical protein
MHRMSRTLGFPGTKRYSDRGARIVRQEREALMRGTAYRRLVTLFGLAVSAALATSMDTGAEAAFIAQRTPTMALAGDHNNTGNGRGNANSVAIRSPAHIHGVQTVADANARAAINRNNAICKQRRHCRIHQRAVNIVH